jgi:hypothetical protein
MRRKDRGSSSFGEGVGNGTRERLVQLLPIISQRCEIVISPCRLNRSGARLTPFALLHKS